MNYNLRCSFWSLPPHTSISRDHEKRDSVRVFIKASPGSVEYGKHSLCFLWNSCFAITNHLH